MKKIGIIGAMELEVETLKSHLYDIHITKKAGMEFFEGTFDNVPVVIVRSGIGKVNAALCVQILVDEFSITHVINTGVAGSLDARLDIGDIVISTDALYHDVDAQIFGYQLGEVPQLGVREFQADADMIAKAKASCEKVNPDVHVLCGRIVSGDQFISSKEVKNHIISTFGGLCTEMEGAAIAQAAFLNQIPFVILRAISDKADDSATEDYPTFERHAAEHCAKLVEDFVTSL
ncbi:MAG: 5'-methylthioadenosine/adenosylhomocysteine nucleosidase [Lachnospiraceae bacterium]